MSPLDVLAIVGSAPRYDKPAFVCPSGLAIAAKQIEIVLTMLTPDRVISGGADGVDDLAEQAAMTHGIPFHAIRPRGRYPTWDSVGGYQERNEQIAQECTRMLRIACAHSRSYGSGWTADRAEELGKPVQRWWIDRDGNASPKKPPPRRRPSGAIKVVRDEQLTLDVVAPAPTTPAPPRETRPEPGGWSDRWLT